MNRLRMEPAFTREPGVLLPFSELLCSAFRQMAPIASLRLLPSAGTRYPGQLTMICNYRLLLTFHRKHLMQPPGSPTQLLYPGYLWAQGTIGVLMLQILPEQAHGRIAWSFAVAPTSVLFSNEIVKSQYFSLNNGTISYALNQEYPVDIMLWDILGKKIFEFNRLQSSGSYSLSLKNRNLPAGVYILHFKAGLLQKKMKIVLPGG